MKPHTLHWLVFGGVDGTGGYLGEGKRARHFGQVEEGSFLVRRYVRTTKFRGMDTRGCEQLLAACIMCSTASCILLYMALRAEAVGDTNLDCIPVREDAGKAVCGPGVCPVYQSGPGWVAGLQESVCVQKM